MTFDELWDQLVRRKPDLATEESIVKFSSPEALKTLLRQTYEQGQKSAAKPVSSPPDFFKDFLDTKKAWP